MRRLLILIPVVVLILALAGCGGSEVKPITPAPTGTTSTATPTPIPGPTPQGQGRLVHVENQDAGGSGKYQFSPKDFNFKLGETITFSMTGETELHTFTVDELGIDEDVDVGETQVFTHTFDKPGTFRLICIIHLANGMEGTITVQ